MKHKKIKQNLFHCFSRICKILFAFSICVTTPHDSKSLFSVCPFRSSPRSVCVLCVCVSFWRRFDVKLFDFLFFLSFFYIRDDLNQLGCIASIASIALIANGAICCELVTGAIVFLVCLMDPVFVLSTGFLTLFVFPEYCEFL